MIDTHCHLTAPQFKSDQEAVIKRALDSGTGKIICVSDSISDIDPCLKLAEKYPQIYATAGVHPHHAQTFDDTRDLEKIKIAAASLKCVAIGEIGLDFHYMHSPRERQIEIFRMQLSLAKELGLPAIIHSRESLQDVWNIVKEIAPRKLVLHCCSEKWEDAKKFVDRGYLLSFTGIVTYPRADSVRETVKNCPIDRLMIETDAPFLAPVPYRGKRNEPAYVVDVAKAVAEVKNVTYEELAKKTTENALEFFGLHT